MIGNNGEDEHLDSTIGNKGDGEFFSSGDCEYLYSGDCEYLYSGDEYFNSGDCEYLTSGPALLKKMHLGFGVELFGEKSSVILSEKYMARGAVRGLNLEEYDFK
ncbi:hypothetical protein CEXT_621901 [Caerostris extrusa]|uniref:Uncharacterized protein n=1 Tax=Caerostris extrusa TaxID=172846 RepID=A0AAV4NAK7_CAEEX|nr:hypothetical protein CEXT_621901 [Caerostris extrusa]